MEDVHRILAEVASKYNVRLVKIKFGKHAKKDRVREARLEAMYRLYNEIFLPQAKIAELLGLTSSSAVYDGLKKYARKNRLDLPARTGYGRWRRYVDPYIKMLQQGDVSVEQIPEILYAIYRSGHTHGYNARRSAEAYVRHPRKQPYTRVAPAENNAPADVSGAPGGILLGEV